MQKEENRGAEQEEGHGGCGIGEKRDGEATVQIKKTVTFRTLGHGHRKRLIRREKSLQVCQRGGINEH